MRNRSNPLTLVTEIRTLLIRVTIAVMKHHGQISVRRKGLICLDSTSLKKFKTRNQAGQKHGSRRGCRGNGGVLLTCLLIMDHSACFLIEYRTTSTGTAKQ